MASKFTALSKKGLVSLPREVKDGLVYEVITGSESYGIADTSQNSDTDLVAVCIPSKLQTFPYLKGEIQGFGKQTVPFTTWQKHHILDKDDNKEYDLTAHGIVKFFNMLLNNNPNILDVLFCHRSSVVFSTQLSELIRENRKLFLSKLSHKSCVGYAYSQLHKIKTKKPLPESKRYESYVKVGYDTKYATHLCRLVLQCEQILMEHDLDIQRNREFLKHIRKGEWTLSQVTGSVPDTV
jgi:predicted nucleotidyltransferase